jgi:hypothetical protein
VGEIDNAHASGANLLFDLVVTELFANHQGYVN